MSEHELFEYNFPKPKDIYWCEELNDYNYIDRGRGNPYAYDNLISYRLAWKAWQASVNRKDEVSKLQTEIDELKKQIEDMQKAAQRIMIAIDDGEIEYARRSAIKMFKGDSNE